MAFVLLLLVATASLIRLNTSRVSEDQLRVKARLNADLGAAAALGDLQRLLGPDARATVPGGQFAGVDPSNRSWVAVYHSEEDGAAVVNRWGDSVSSGERIDWLVSGDSRPDPGNRNEVSNDFQPATDDRVVLLGSGTVADPSQSVTAGRVNFSDQGSYAWWIGDESLKASILPAPSVAQTAADEARVQISQTPAQMALSSVTGLEGAASDSLLTAPLVRDEIGRALGVPDESVLMERYHDLTAGSWGLLTNSREGGLQYDLTWAVEAPDALFQSEIRNRPEVYELVARSLEPFASPPAGRELIGVPSLEIVRDYHGLKDWSGGGITLADHRRMEPSRPPEGSAPQTYPDGLTPPYHRADADGTWFHEAGQWFSNYHPQSNPVFPILARFVFRFGLEYDFDGFKDPPPAENIFPGTGYRTTRVRFHYQPIFVLYNPHNVALELGDIPTVLGGSMPRGLVRVTITPANGDPERTVAFRLAEIFPRDNSGREYYTNLRLDANDNVVIEPGEAISFGFQNTASEVQMGNLAWMPLSSNWNPATRLVHEIRLQSGGPNNPVVAASEPGPSASHFDADWYEWDSPMNVTDHGPGGRITSTTDAENRMSKFGLTTDENDDLKAGHQQDFVSVEIIFDGETIGTSAASFSNTQRGGGVQYNLQALDGVMNPAMGAIRLLDERFAGDFSGSLDYGFSLELAAKDDVLSNPAFDAGSGWFENGDFPEIPFRPLIDANVRAMAFGPGSSGLTTSADRRQTTVLPYRLKAGLQSSAAHVLQVNLDPNEPTSRGSTYVLTGATSGSGNLPLFEIPREPLQSLGQLQHAALSHLPQSPSYAVANSYASVRVPQESSWVRTITRMPQIDLSYFLNRSLYDRFFFSGVTADLDDADWAAMRSGERLPPHPRRLIYDLSGEETSLDDLRSGGDASSFFTNAARFIVSGAFNVNSVSVEAWKALLASGQGGELPRLNPEQPTSPDDFWEPGSNGAAFFSRFTRPHGESPLQGVRVISEAELQDLAETVVREVRERGPFLSVADFVNRSLETGENGLRGALQEALDETINATGFVPSGGTLSDTPYAHWEPGQVVGDPAAGYPGWVLQGDVLQRLDSVLRVRGDTFTIRVFGQAEDSLGGSGSDAWCELTVQRFPEPVGFASLAAGDREAELRNPGNPFGRQFRVINYRWIEKENL